MNRLVSAALAIVSLLVTFALLEGTFRVLPLLSSKERSFAFDRERPQQFVLPLRSAEMRGNDDGAQKRDQEYRLVVVGDSFSFAPGMQFFSTFAKQLEMLLRLKSDVTVWNLGNPGFSTVHELESFRHALTLKPDAILLQVTLNDPQERPLQEEPASIRGAFGPYQPENFLTRHSRFASWVGQRLHNSASVNAYIRYHQRLWDEQWARFEQPVRAMQVLAQEQGVGFGVVVFPLFDFPLNDTDYPFLAEHTKIVRFVRDELKVPVLDLYRDFRGLDPYRLQLLPGRDSHPNEIAHRIAAERIYWWLRGRDFFPTQRKLNRLYPKRDNLHEMQFAQHERVRQEQR